MVAIAAEWDRVQDSVVGRFRVDVVDLELFPPLAEAKPWDWTETDEGKPVVVVERHASFTGLDGGSVDLTAPIPNPAVF